MYGAKPSMKNMKNMKKASKEMPALVQVQREHKNKSKKS
jgi:hypothetical protein